MTATTRPPEALEPKKPIPQRPEVDPEHDIDAKTTLTWLVVWTLAIFVCLWLLLQVFKVVLFEERLNKVETLEPIDIEELHRGEEAILGGGMREDGTRGISIRDAMEELVGR